MTLSSRDIEGIQRKPVKRTWFSGFLIGIVRLSAKIPYINNKIRNSSGGISGRIFRCWNNNDYDRALEISIYALERFRNKKDRFVPGMEHHTWWQFMKHGVDSAKHIDSWDLKEKLIRMANEGIQPYEGYDVAYTYLEFSRWEFKRKQYETAIAYAKIASKADCTWAEPEFILGWYALLLGIGDAEEHLGAAIKRDHSVLFRVVNNDICKKYPHIISKLKSKYTVSEIASFPNY